MSGGPARLLTALVAAGALLLAACGGDGGDAGTGDGAPTIEATNFAFAPRELSVAPGATIRIRNGNASTTHTFTVPGQGIDVEVIPLATERVAVDLAPGTYRFVCRLHAAQGMEGTLTVAA